MCRPKFDSGINQPHKALLGGSQMAQLLIGAWHNRLQPEISAATGWEAA